MAMEWVRVYSMEGIGLVPGTQGPGGGGGQLPLKGGHHQYARLWTFKMDPKPVSSFDFSHPKQVFGHVFPTLNKYFVMLIPHPKQVYFHDE